MTSVLGFLEVSVTYASGFPRLQGVLDTSHLEDVASALAVSVAERRVGVNSRLHDIWTSHHIGSSTGPVEETDLELLEAGLLEDIGTPADLADPRRLHGLVAEAIWFEVLAAVDAGLGMPIRIEAHGWSVIDPGGDGLTVYTTPGGFCFRLWESKHHGTSAAVRETANLACRQLLSRSLSYLSRFALIAQDMAGDTELAAFYGRLPELWVDRDPNSGVGISVAAGENADIDRDFDNIPSYFNLDLRQHQAALHLMGDSVLFAQAFRNEIWKGCGLWTAP